MARWHAVVLILLVALEAQATEIWPSAVTGVERGLGSGDVAKRRAAALKLSDLPPSALRRLLPTAFGDGDPEVRLAAVAAANGLSSLPPLRVSAWLQDPDVRLRLAAAQLLQRAPDPRVIPDLVRSLGDADAAVRGEVVEALVATGQPNVVLPLLGRIDDSDAVVRERVLGALSQLGDPRATLPLIGKLQDPRPELRSRAARALGKLKDPRAVSALMLALSDPEAEVKVAVASALGDLQAVQAVDVLAPLARSAQNEALALAALSSLARIQSPRAAAAFVQTLTSAGDEVLQLALQSLQEASPLLLEPLGQCLAGQPAESLANACLSALGELSGERAGALLLEALDRHIGSAQVALVGLRRLRHQPALASGLGSLGSSDAEVRQRAAELVLALLDPEQPDGRAVEPLLRALAAARAEPKLQEVLVVALGNTGSPRASTALQGYLSDKLRPQLRLLAARALGFTGGDGAAKALVPLLDERDAELRQQAALSLRRIADLTLLPELWQRLTQAPAQDREALALALAGPFRQLTEPAQLLAVAGQAMSSAPRLREALLESIRFIPGEAGAQLLFQVAEHDGSDATRAKVAEVLAAREAGAPYLERLARSNDPSVRANVAWALAGSRRGAQTLAVLARDADHAVASNALASLVRAHEKAPELPATLCAALADHRAYVRVNALVGLRWVKRRCMGGRERSMLSGDSSAQVRRAAALLLGAVPSPEPERDELARARCLEQEVESGVAEACQAKSSTAPVARLQPVNVFVVPHNSTQPEPRAPFALLTSHGFIRSGWTDQRGAVLEMASPAAPLRLVVAPQFVTVE